MDNQNAESKLTPVLPFDETTSMYRAQVTSSITKGLTRYHQFLTELGTKTAVDTLVNESMKKGLAVQIRYQATLVRNMIGDKVQTMSNLGIDAENIARFVKTYSGIHDSLIQLAEDVQKGTA